MVAEGAGGAAAIRRRDVGPKTVLGAAGRVGLEMLRVDAGIMLPRMYSPTNLLLVDLLLLLLKVKDAEPLQ